MFVFPALFRTYMPSCVQNNLGKSAGNRPPVFEITLGDGRLFCLGSSEIPNEVRDDWAEATVAGKGTLRVPSVGWLR